MLLVALLTLLVIEVTPLPALEARFHRTSGWSGADGVHSVRLPSDRVLWLFGDTFVGPVAGGKRAASTRMVHITAAVQDLGGFRFVVREGPSDLLAPPGVGEWYWPGDMCVVEGRLYVFLMRVREVKGGPEGFNFEVVGHDLLAVRGNLDDPLRWDWRRARMPAGSLLGAACVADDGYLYAYGLLPGAGRRLAVARISLASLRRLDMGAWSWWDGATWGGQPAALFDDGATEMTVSRVKGQPGFFAVYTPMGLGSDVFARHAARPEGPWSAPVRLFTAMEPGLLVYGARAHPALSSAPGEMVVTYNRNIADFEAHFTRPDVYRPRAFRVRLRMEGTSSTNSNKPAPFGQVEVVSTASKRR